MSNSLLVTFNQIIRYILVGGLVYLIDISTFTALVMVDAEYSYANIYSKLIAALAGFFFHKYITFRGEQHSKMTIQLLNYFGLLMFNISLSTLILFVLIGHYKVFSIQAKIIADITVIITSFVISKYVVYRLRS